MTHDPCLWPRFGDLSDYSAFSYLKFSIVATILLIPLALMNLLIAIMNDSYARVQENVNSLMLDHQHKVNSKWNN